jgi:hypothetical protein
LAVSEKIAGSARTSQEAPGFAPATSSILIGKQLLKNLVRKFQSGIAVNQQA